MKLEEIRTIAKKHQIKAGRSNKMELIRSIQQAEGNPQCFNSDTSKVCGQQGCLWRGDCA
ncbi:MAG: SAP domain-containing protein [Geobacter sp.]|nr:SAP domain-containing protein [Geobacter sp.]